MNETLNSTISIELTWKKSDESNWESDGLYGAAISVNEDGKYVATLYAPIAATRWDPEDVTEVAERVFDDFVLARQWVLAKETERASQELLAEIEIEEGMVE